MKIKYLLLFFASAFLLSCSETIDTEDNNKDDEYKIEKVEFTESLENFVNPERGFYRFF
jgi:outer membrane biogenesis lipoprotein LolB